MTTATATQIKTTNTDVSIVKNHLKKESHKKATAHLRAEKKHYLLYNLGVLLAVSKFEKIENHLETAASILREYEFLNLVTGAEMNILKSI